MGPGFGYIGGCGIGGGFGMMFFGLIIIGLIIYFIVKGQNNHHQYVQKSVPNSEALEIAKIRLAKGEITTEEYENIRKNLL
ncbi:SHOCT domain-containing protein [Tepidibacillus fermentans]|uniref:Putative membrane protein n=1 Tax=Tepidibacillus fermentans TaxID=1281767 RepID=A0A4R3KMA4_9BACI|nr:SHOCT domain-containing protein [Tepidibacillus fermentans]TCS84596.1 putative membrane protein [Tepidibacillus fermentans]